jgi:hypothetical protein
MSKPNNGGPAKDASLLAYYAGQAMQGMVIRGLYLKDDGLAPTSFDIAEAMIAELRRRKG